jgi:predicted transcriptional regulator
LLTSLITERGFSSAHAYATEVGLSPSYIYKIMDGKCPPPPKHLAVMADVLRLKGKERYRFVLQAAFAHVPDQVSTMLGGLKSLHVHQRP